MIQLHPSYLMFDLANGETVPCSAETVTFELIGDAASHIDPELIKDAAAAVLHYFQSDLQRDHVSVGEFSEALERVLKGFGLAVNSMTPKGPPAQPVVEADLDSIAQEAGDAGELMFFQNLRQKVREQVKKSPGGRISFRGLRPCVKHLLGTRRWSRRCEGMSDRIVDYVRECLTREESPQTCAVMIH